MNSVSPPAGFRWERLAREHPRRRFRCGQVDFGDLTADVTKRLPRRALPVAVLAWLGVSSDHQGQGLGRLLLGQALRDCYEAGRTFAFTAVVLDCLNDAAKSFYQKWDFQEIPGHPYRLFISAQQLADLMGGG